MMGKLPSSRALASVIFVGLSSPLLLGTASAAETKEVVVDAKISNESSTCLQCHGPLTPALAAEWRQSAHAAKGVGCYECHRADKTNPGAFEHNGATITVIVSPKDCGSCHQAEVDQ